MAKKKTIPQTIVITGVIYRAGRAFKAGNEDALQATGLTATEARVLADRGLLRLLGEAPETPTPETPEDAP